MSKELNEKRGKARKKIFIETFLVFFIVISPFIFKMHEYVSSSPDATLNIFGLTIDKNGFPNINVYIWFLLGKIVPLYLLLIWFFTCKHWWYHIIIIPVLMYAFQIFEGVISEDNYIDTDNIFWLLPFCMIVVPFVYFIRIRLYDKHVHGIDLEAMEVELNELKAKRSKLKVGKKNALEEQSPDSIEYRSLSEWLDAKLSTGNLELILRQFQNSLKNWMHLKF